MSYPPLDDEDIDELVFGSQLPVIVYVTGSCCRLASAAKREFLAAAHSFQDSIAIYEVDGTRQEGLTSRLNIMAIPALLLYVSGTEKAALLGFYGRDELHKRLWSIISDRI